MSDGIKRTIAAVIGAGGIAYISWLIAQWQTFVPESLIANQLVIGIVFIALFFALILWLAIKPLAIKRLKWWVAAYSILLILLSNYFLIDKADQGIYAGDIVSVIGVIIFFLSVSGVILTKKAKKKLQSKIQEVIEV